MNLEPRAVARFITDQPIYQFGDDLGRPWTPTEREGEIVDWFANVTAVAEYVTDRGAFPPVGHHLYIWLGEQERAGLSRRHRWVLDGLVPGWELGHTWSARLGTAAAFKSANGRVPNPRAEDTAERSLGRWVEQQRLAGRSDTFSTRRRTALDARVPGWDQTSLDARWHAQHKVVAEHYEANGVLPTAADSQRAADWIEKQAERLPTAGAGRRAAADKLTPGLAAGVAESKWVATGLKVAEFLADNDRLPSRKAAADVERLLGAWLHNQRIRLRGDAPKVRARAAALDVLVTGWRGTGQPAAA
jgi:hypothetical protein